MSIAFTEGDAQVVGFFLESFFYGLYSGIFFIYLQYNWVSWKWKALLFYAICVLYVLSAATVALDVEAFIYNALGSYSPAQRKVGVRNIIVADTIIGCCDFMSQFILIYRCWIVWGGNLRVVIIPSILAFVYLATWLSTNASLYDTGQETVTTAWGYPVTLTSLVLSLTVNTLTTGLILYRICKVYREVKLLNSPSSGVTGGSSLRSVIVAIVESGMILFAVQLLRVILSVTAITSDAAYNAFHIIVGTHQMLNGITPTVILVRVKMGLSYHDEGSMIETIASLHFVPGNMETVDREAEGIRIVCQAQERNDDHEDIGHQLRNDIRIVDI